MPHLTGNSNVLLVLIAGGAGFGVVVVERDGHAGLGHSGLALLVDKLLETRGTDLGMPRTRHG